MKKNDGGPAFPSEQGTTPDGTWNQTYDPGMSLRDWFAGMAMNGQMAAQDAKDKSAKGIAKWSYEYADAMLKAREAE